MIIKESYIRQISKSRWRVFSEKGKNLGTFPSKSKAQKRLRQVEMFKHMKSSSERISDLLKICEAIDKDHNKKDLKPKLTYSSVMRKLRKEYEEDIRKFQEVFKDQFEESLDKQLSNPENIALIAAIKAINFKE